MEETSNARSLGGSRAELPAIPISGDWDLETVIDHRSAELASAFGARIAGRRWFGAKAKTLQAVQIVDAVKVTPDGCLAIVRVDFAAGPSEFYQIPLGMAVGPKAERMAVENSAELWARLQAPDAARVAVLHDGLIDPAFCAALLRLIESRTELQGRAGQLVVWQVAGCTPPHGGAHATLMPKPVQAEQSNSSVLFGDRWILKLFRRIDAGVNPDLEVNAWLTERGFKHIPPLGGALEYRRTGQEHWALAMLQGFVPNQGDAWRYTLDRLDGFFAKVLDASHASAVGLQPPVDGLTLASKRAIPLQVSGVLSDFLADARLLGTRTAELHAALAAPTDNRDFAPEPFTVADQRAFHDRCTASATETFDLLTARLAVLPPAVAARAARVAGRVGDVVARLDRQTSRRIDVEKIRCHGDFHLGQVLRSADDFVILDFEGEPARPLSQRREKQLALRDVAGMIRSFHYASYFAANDAKRRLGRDDVGFAEPWADVWHFWISAAFLASYLQFFRNVNVQRVAFLPDTDAELQHLLEVCLLEKAVYELRYELNNRPDWVILPLLALEGLLGD